MREAAEAFDHVTMGDGETQRVFIAQGLVQLHRGVLILDILAMHEGQVKELARGRLDRLIVILFQRAPGVIQHDIVAFKGPPAAAKDIARELVQRDDQRQRVIGRLHPMFQLARMGGLVTVQKIVLDPLIHLVRLFEPQL